MGLAVLSKQVAEMITEFIKHNQIWYLRILLFRILWEKKKTDVLLCSPLANIPIYVWFCLTQTNKNNDNNNATQ